MRGGTRKGVFPLVRGIWGTSPDNFFDLRLPLCAFFMHFGSVFSCLGLIRQVGHTSLLIYLNALKKSFFCSVNNSVVPIVASYRKLVAVAKNRRQSIETFHYR